jgi:hypothetical protein
MFQPGDVADRADRRAADLAGSFRDVVRHRQNLRRLLVEKKVVIPAMRAGYMPVGILGLDVKCEDVCQKRSESGRNILGAIRTEIARRVERLLAPLPHFFYGHSDRSFSVDLLL